MLIGTLIPSTTIFATNKKTNFKNTAPANTFYEIFVGSFYDSNNDGIGDLNGIDQKLDYLSNLGVTGLWTTPIMTSPSYHKYDVVDYYSIDPQFGTMADFEKLNTDLKKHNIDWILDLVLNHTSDQNEWFKKALAGDAKYKAYYTWSTTPKDGYNKASNGEYYLSWFSPQMPELNLDNKDVRNEIKKIVKFWLDKGVSGFRLDAVGKYYEDNNIKNAKFLKWLNKTVKSIKPDAYMVGENWSDTGSITTTYKSGIDSLFDFPFATSGGKLITDNLKDNYGVGFSEELQTFNNGINKASKTAVDAPFLSNHDGDRVRSILYVENDYKFAASVYLMMPGNPFIYYGEEIGLNGSGTDPNRRLPMIFSVNNSAGQPKNPEGATQNPELTAGVDEQEKDPKSLLNWYKKLIAIRNKYPQFKQASVKNIETSHDEISDYIITTKKGKYEIIQNFSATKEFKIKRSGKVAEKFGVIKDPSNKKEKINLQPYSTVIIKKG
jgi:alpha-amylase